MRWMLACSLAIGCAASRPPIEPGVRLRSDAPWPFEVTRAEVWLDDELVYLRTAQEWTPAIAAHPIAELPSGDHLVWAELTMRLPCRPAAGSDAYVWTIRS